jgi:hypothetical protein
MQSVRVARSEPQTKGVESSPPSQGGDWRGGGFASNFAKNSFPLFRPAATFSPLGRGRREKEKI